ncbi:hypothetical protein [Leisingera sp. S232]|uniref:hypothetical protein n=1 Tax=Leisingera sp. S232 TaxID=3415132 RepID=UPI003C7BBDE0
MSSAQDGIKRVVETEVTGSNLDLGVGCVQGRTTIDFETDSAAKAYSDKRAYDDQISSAFFCGVAGTKIPKHPLVNIIAGLTCAAMSIDTRHELRKGDRIVERSYACAAGGVGGTIEYDIRTAIGQRDGKKVVLYTLSFSTDAERVKTLVEEELERY